jgi:hypothetical protein
MSIKAMNKMKMIQDFKEKLLILTILFLIENNNEKIKNFKKNRKNNNTIKKLKFKR